MIYLGVQNTILMAGFSSCQMDRAYGTHGVVGCDLFHGLKPVATK
jgi:hypothetical protein